MRAPLLAVLAALSPALPARAARDKGTFTLAEAGEVTSLDPALAYDVPSQEAILSLYDTLVSFDGSSVKRFVPILATKVPTLENGGISRDGRVYRFTIRKGVRFHDGSPMTPQDVRYSLLRFMISDRVGGPSALLLEPITGSGSTRDASGKITLDYGALAKAVSVDGDDVVIRLKRPFAPFLSILARWSFVESQRWAAAHGEWGGLAADWKRFNNQDPEQSYFNEHEDGTGPFTLERWDRVAKYVVLKRSDSYFRPRAHLARVVLKTVPEFATRRLMLQAGDADLIETPRPMIDQLKGLGGVKVEDDLPRLVTDPVIFFTFKINAFANRDVGSGRLDGNGIPPDFFSDPDVRKGFAYAFDYDGFIQGTYQGSARRAKGPVPPGVPGYDPNEPYYTYDLAKSAEHFKKAFDTHLWDRGFRFTLTYNVGSEDRQAAAQILKKNVESLNPRFRIDVRGVEWPAFLDAAQQHRMPIFVRGWWADYPDAHNFVYNFYDSSGRYPSAQGFSDFELDQLVEKAVRAVDAKKRQELYDRIAKVGYDDCPAIFTVHPRGVYAMRDWVRGFVDNPVYLGVYFYPISKD